jgi:hypothetical protein
MDKERSAPGFPSPSDLTQKTAGATVSWRRSVGKLHPIAATVIWLVVFASCFTLFVGPDAFRMFRGSEQRKWGFIDANGQVVIKPTFDRVKGIGVPSKLGPIVCCIVNPHKSFNEGLAAVCVGEQWGFIDKTGKIIVEPQYDDVGDFSEGLACVIKNDKLGFIDRTGKVVIPLQFDGTAFDGDLTKFNDGVCVVKRTPFSMIYIDKKGNDALGKSFTDAAPFSEGLAVVDVMKNARVIDRSGNVVLSIPINWRRLGSVLPAGRFSEGYLRICGYDHAENPRAHFWFVDKTGKAAGSGIYESAHDFSDGLAAVMLMGTNKYGFIDQTGKSVIEPAYESPGDFHEGLAPVRLYHKDKEADSDLWGYIDRTGNLLVQPQFTNAQSFSQGRAAVRIGKGASQREGYIDKTGRLTIPANYYKAFPFSEGLAAVEMPVPSAKQ